MGYTGVEKKTMAATIFDWVGGVYRDKGKDGNYNLTLPVGMKLSASWVSQTRLSKNSGFCGGLRNQGV